MKETVDFGEELAMAKTRHGLQKKPFTIQRNMPIINCVNKKPLFRSPAARMKKVRGAGRAGVDRATACEGTGMGLAIVHQAVERMGGQRGVESEAGQGGKFWIQMKGANA